MHEDDHEDHFLPDSPGETQRLASIAFRMLGSTFDANTAVDATIEQWRKLPSQERALVGSPREWLTETISRVCFERLSTDPSLRENYLGEWLPEPVPFIPLNDAPLSSPESREHITLDESVSMLLMVVLDSLTAEERVAFILHDVFGVDFAGIATVVGRSPAESRRLAESARHQIQKRRRHEVSVEQQRQMVLDLLTACEARDERAVQVMLHPLVTLLVDSGGKGRTIRGPVEGAEATASKLIQMLVDAPAMVIAAQPVNGGSGLVFRYEERVIGVLSVNVEADRISNIWIVTNPDKLLQWNMP